MTIREVGDELTAPVDEPPGRYRAISPSVKPRRTVGPIRARWATQTTARSECRKIHLGGLRVLGVAGRANS